MDLFPHFMGIAMVQSIPNHASVDQNSLILFSSYQIAHE
jgi:hypothetical protein